MLDPRFQAAEAQYRTLRAEYDSGALAQAPFEAAVRGLMIEHEGRWWSIGAGTGHWFVAQGDAWVQSLPPGMDEPPPAPPESASAPHPATPAAQPATPPTHPVPPPSRPIAPPRRGNPVLLRIGITLMVIGAGSFVLPFFGMQFRLISLFGGSQQLVGVIVAVIGLVLVLVGQAGGGGQRPAQPQPQYQAPGSAPQVPYTPPRRGNGCLIGCLVTLGVVVAMIIAAAVFLVPPTVAYINMIKDQLERSSTQPTGDDSSTVPTGDSSTVPTGDDGARVANGLPPPLPACPPGYVPPAPSLGQPQQPTCDPSLPPQSGP